MSVEPALVNDVLIAIDGGGELRGVVTLPPRATGMVVFAHGSGSSRFSPRNRLVAGVLHAAGLGTALFDLLTSREAEARANVFDIPLLAGRLGAIARGLRAADRVGPVSMGYFGASTGAAAAMVAAASDSSIGAVVSRGGRPDLAMAELPSVRAPTLLIVGGDDPEVLEMNRAAYGALRCEKALEVVPGATHLFEEPGTLEAVASLAREWFVRHLGAGRELPGG